MFFSNFKCLRLDLDDRVTFKLAGFDKASRMNEEETLDASSDVRSLAVAIICAVSI